MIPEDVQSRRARLLADAGCRAFVVLASSSRDPDLAGFVGPARFGPSVLVWPAEGDPRLVCLSPLDQDEAAGTGLELLDPEVLDLGRLAQGMPTPEAHLARTTARLLEAAGVEPGRIAVAGQGSVGETYGALRLLADAGWTPVPGAELSRLLRKTKDARQLAAARHAAVGAATALRQVAELLVEATPRDGHLELEGEPLRVGRLRFVVGRILGSLGLEQPAGNLIQVGAQAASPHHPGRDETILRPREPIVVDLFPRSWLFTDCCRTFCVGPPPEPLASAHEIVADTLSRVRAKARPGGRAFSLQDAACGHLSRAGYPTPLTAPGSRRGYIHELGHGVGFELHEFPSFRRGAGEEGVLAGGDLVALELGIYEPQLGFGLRLEDVCIIGDRGAEPLVELPYSLDPNAWF